MRITLDEAKDTEFQRTIISFNKEFKGFKKTQKKHSNEMKGKELGYLSGGKGNTDIRLTDTCRQPRI